MLLIYRGQFIEYRGQPKKPYHEPNAINWRYQISRKTYQSKALVTKLYHYPKALN